LRPLPTLLLTLALIASVVGCASEGPPPVLDVDLHRVTVRGDDLQEIVVFDAAGLVLGRRAGPADHLSLLHGASPGAELTVEVVGSASQVLHGAVPPDPGPLQVDVDVPAGQGATALQSEHRFTAVEGAAVRAGVVVTVARPGTVRLEVGDHREDLTLTAPGERRVVFVDIPSDRRTLLTVTLGERVLQSMLVPTAVSRSAARESLLLSDVAFPADASGQRSVTRPAGRVTLPARWWRSLLHVAGLGMRAQDPYGPWAHQAVTLENRGPEALNVVVLSRVLDEEGGPADAFRPKNRDRDGQSGEVASLLRIPGGERAVATLPFFVDATGLPEGATTWVREVAVTPLGSSEPLWVHQEPLQVRRGSSWISLAFAFALLGGLLGVVLVVLKLRTWLEALRTADLVTVAVFATLSFLVSGASTLVSAVVSALLGPFAVFLTNLLDDALRYALLATLVTLLPRPGVAALSVLLTWLMSGVALGAFSPVDVVYVGAKLFWLEAALYAAGITRGVGPQTGVRRWLRLGAGFSVASVLTALTGLAVAMVLYRLYYAGWYVGAVLAGPGFLYVWIACGLAVGFAASLRRVEA
jgi:hypothetical protein